MSIETAERLAKQWMQGTRDGSRRPSWEHPHDLVKLLEQVPGLTPEALEMAKQVAWLHDVIEDGITVTGEPVDAVALSSYGFPDEVVEAVLALTCAKKGREAKVAYLMSLHYASELVRVVKAVDRICNLREGAREFDNKRWVRYVGETLYFVVPLLDNLPDEPRLFLKQELKQAIKFRPLFPT